MARFLGGIGPGILGLGAIGLVLAAQPATAALPARDAGVNYFPYSVGYSDGDLYVFGGDKIYRADPDGLGDFTYTAVVSGIRNAFGAPTRQVEGIMATAPGGKALVTLGFTDGGVLKVDLATGAKTVIADFNSDGIDDNVFSAAGQSDGDFYAQFAEPFSFSPPSSSTRVFRVDGGNTPSFAVDPAAGDFSGGMAFAPNGDLIVGTFITTGVFPDPTGAAKFFRVTAGDLTAFESGGDPLSPIYLGSGVANGNNSIVVGSDGNVYLNTGTGIGRFDPDTGVLTDILAGYDINDPLIYDPSYVNLPLNGLTFDAATNSLVFARHTGGGVYELDTLAIPEPATAWAVMLCGAALWRRRRAV